MELASVLENICSVTIGIRDGKCDILSGTVPQGLSLETLSAPVGNHDRFAALIPEWNHVPNFNDGVGLVIDIPGGVTLDKPVGVLLSAGSCNIVISAAARAQAEFIFVYSDVKSVGRFAVTGEETSLRIRDIVVAESQNNMNIGSWVKLDRNTSVDVATVELSNCNISMDYGFEFGLPGGDLKHAALSVIGGSCTKTLDINVKHAVPECRSDVVMKGIAFGEGFGTFNGLVYVAPDAQHTEAYQQSRNMILSDKARIVTSPQLEIYADDVKCSHGAAVGQMNDDAVYYMRQRGLSDAEARTLQLSGFVNEIVARLDVPELVEELSAVAQERINSLPH